MPADNAQWTRVATSNSGRCRIGSQCSCRTSSEMRSHCRMPVANRAAVFWITILDRRRCRSYSALPESSRLVMNAWNTAFVASSDENRRLVAVVSRASSRRDRQQPQITCHFLDSRTVDDTTNMFATSILTNHMTCVYSACKTGGQMKM